jgi:hypothetical protein
MVEGLRLSQHFPDTAGCRRRPMSKPILNEPILKLLGVNKPAKS